ncbi:hypothetical protein Q4561_00200 [Alteromonas sp. 1_MG-2023]|uniref:hypothetical protein n=1 Tax=Alteromonas sp. 1_MG-2023 TaxID=3062669 RepID=UPI0026E2A4E1|nr:hypothetical protein [Alteromonas sp. 1_MG-2023]MDO6565466.1 hypothetical protein [Alteromonas sp. 1_MG-2023]
MSLQNNNLQQLMIVCQQMHQNGTTPSVALLRAKAPFKVSVAEAIGAIKHFNATSGAAKTVSSLDTGAPHDTNSPDDKDTETVVSLSKRVKLLEEQIRLLQKQLDASFK